MNTKGLIGLDDLKTLTGYNRQGDIEKCLYNNGIRFFSGRNTSWTTIDLMNAAGGISTNDDNYSELEVL